MSNQEGIMSSYTDRAGIDNRANSALLRIERIVDDHRVPSAIRLAQIAKVMEDEPILTDDSPAAHTVRSELQMRKS